MTHGPFPRPRTGIALASVTGAVATSDEDSDHREDPASGRADQAEDARVSAVRAVLAGRSAAAAAAEAGVPVELVERWVEAFVRAGTAAVTAADVVDGSMPDHFLSVVAHEMRTPLAAVATALNLLTDPRLPQDRRTAVAGLVTGRLDALSRLCDDVLDGAAVALGRVTLDVAPLDVRELATAVITDTDPDQLRLVSGEPVRMLGDAERLQQLVSNLVRNALRHSVGDVRIAVTRTALEAVITVSHHARTTIDADEARSWFEPFAGRSGRTGNGLGLYVVRALTVAHGGTTGVDSSACDEGGSGQDLHTWVRLPLAGPPTR